ncbi:glycoside hydrolase family 2 protein [Polymorphum gilvum]|uniref:Glycoside hydrolase family 2, immunoglobulin-like beta-sandwich n=1 Tax=Polymorphum gilvum (strain LMG 25793 / CGMCC 1.9160 / SL003B-26A1) TaxID=991905 RepID=F2J5G8_POLGS|nr:glycoside hydrolase family 2 protein [Polymorphum gilvum]ADZ72338.1 Glycoside hydrolase family 2, immunoglobulin-like beta-sandwich [Polymorphum gilvum SL003B-26A1]
MRRIYPAARQAGVRLDASWRMAVTDAGAVAGPADLSPALDWIPAPVPGTAAEALRLAGRYRAEAPSPLHDKDIWYLTEVRCEAPGDAVLVLDGLATIAEVYWNGALVLRSDSMFRAHEVAVEAGTENTLAICFRALYPRLDAKGPRARWRPQLALHQGLRLVRTTLLGHMPGWCPEVHAVGPWRPVHLIENKEYYLEVERFSAILAEDGSGRLEIVLKDSGFPPETRLKCAGSSAVFGKDPDGRRVAHLTIPDVAPWWPHTHGTPTLHEVTIEAAGTVVSLGRTGFRRIEVDRGSDGRGFGLRVNGVGVFCRGAVWTSADIVRLPGDRDAYRPWLALAAEAGMNMLRIGGTMAYESPAFFELCDDLGILVWQDFQFANYDYPVADEAFAASVREEARQLLERTQANPSLAVLCGGSEIYQQGAMLGLPESRWKGPLTEDLLPSVCAELRPDVSYVPNAPCDGAMPFSPNEGVAHYYGVGAYRRPLEDARRAEVRFAAECLAFANVPQQATLDAHLAAMPGHDPRWKQRVPRDRGVGWDFEDVRDHYVRLLHGVEPAELRYGDPARYLDFGRAAGCAVMEACFAEWRRAASTCRGALVWTFQDLLPGAGWGVVDATGEPKPVWYALKRAFRPVQVSLTDEGTNGLSVHVLNETASDRPVVLTLACLRDGSVPVVSGRREMMLAARSNAEIAATDLFGAFFDTTYAYRFGPPAHDVTVARLLDPDTGAVLAEAFHFLPGCEAGRLPPALDATVDRDLDGAWTLTLKTDRLARSVHVFDPAFRPADDWFHLAPGADKRVRLVRRAGADLEAVPQGEIAAINGAGVLRYKAG